MLEITRLCKSYPTPGGQLQVLSDISLTLARGEAASIMGPSGSGKSTLLYILGALDPPTSGTVTLDGRNPFGLPEKQLAAFRNRQVGFVFQDHCLLPQCSVLENVLVPTLVAESRNGDRDRARALARALIREPLLLLCDEPTGNLDLASAETVASMLFDLHRSRQTILIVVTHNPDLAAKFPVRLELAGKSLKRV